MSALLLGCEAEDLMRLRVSISPLRNLVDALHDGPRADGGVARARWWAEVRRNVPGRALPLVEMINAHPRFVPLPLVPLAAGESGPVKELATELDALEATDPERVRAEVELYLTRARLPRPPGDLLRLRDGGRREVRELAQGLRALFDATVGEDWAAMRAALRRHVAGLRQRADLLGLGPAAGSLHGGVRWLGPERALQVRVAGLAASSRVELGGRGLVLMPSLFGLDQTLPVLDPTRQPTLSYPMRPAPAVLREGDGLAGLIGAGRARALRAIGSGCTTGELATRLGVSAPTASQHTAALRNADLIVSVREGQRVRHLLTDLGDALLSANPVGRRPGATGAFRSWAS
ncbi:ArsR/SmtB family transcription factor [Streptacidiphilus jiangxiensis]|uniref:Helix-turn-helix domain-containing protein n=1 Tax=Streptacidiphilus jiangxiensis TaxID=235985 RepID=A0A1H7VGJ1_STRJI|nr:helix-turn-helix domain-containing protein [Streptacidiphilus jiangxiensis]SEM08009.1 Helix-turn-helix domain-containing protein [Streptacidiphilus jiangxiensis]